MDHTKSKPLVLVIDILHPKMIPSVEEMGYECVRCEERSKTEIAELLPQATGILIRHRFLLDAEFLSKASQLKWIGRSGVGLDAVDIDYCKSRGISVLNAAGGNADAVSEHAIGMILNLLNHLKRADAEVRQGIWKREANRGKELGSLTVGIIGYGHTGRSLAKKLSGFGCTVIAYDKYAPVDGPYAEPAGLAQIQRQTDILSFHVPLTEETKHYFDSDLLAAMDHPFYLVNASRGPVCDAEAIAGGLRERKIIGAALDVLEEEGKDNSTIEYKSDALKELMDSDRVLFSPHIAGWTEESYEGLADILLERIRQIG